MIWFKKLLLISGLPLVLFAEMAVIEQQATAVIIEYRMGDLQEHTIQLGTETCQWFQIENGVMEEPYGMPAIPHIQTRLAVPSGSRVSYQISILEQEVRESVMLLPQGALEFPDQPVSRIVNPEIYSSALPYPQQELILGEEYDFRGVNVIPLRIYPIRYLPQGRQVTVIKRMRVVFRFSGGNSLPTPRTFGKHDREAIESKIVNSGQAANFASPRPVSLRKTAVNYDLSSGAWYRIPISEEGIYQITGAALRAAGIPIGDIQLANVHLYSHGGFALPYSVSDNRPQDLNEIAVEVVDVNQNGIMDDDDRIIFYGKGLGGWRARTINGRLTWEYYGNPDGSRTLFPYDDTNYYIFTYDGNPGKRIPALPSPQDDNARRPVRFTDYYHFEQDQHNILSSGLDWYWLKMTGISDKKSTPFTLPQNLVNDSMRLEFRFQGGSGILYGNRETYRYTLRALMNSQVVLDNIIFTNNYTMIRTVNQTQLFGITAGNNNLEIQHTGNLEGCEVYLDHFEVTVKRPFIAENNALRFRDLLAANSAVEYQLSGFPAGDNVVWDISDFANVRRIIPLQNSSNITFQEYLAESRGVDYWVYAPSTIRDIPAIERLENRSNLRDPGRRAQFIIITPDEFYDAAEFLEVWRETQIPGRLETERVSLQHIFQEFSSTVRDVTAIRDFIKYAYENWQDTLQHVLLLGDGHYDYRGIRVTDIPNYIPTFQITYQGDVDSRETDNYYVALGMRNDLANIDPTLSVARLPVNNLAQIEVYRDKAEKYSTSYQLEPERNGWQTWLTFVSDDQKGGTGSDNEFFYHLQPTEYISSLLIPKKFNLNKIYLHDYEQIAGGLGRWKPKATEDLVNQINRGTLLINFFGHGDQDTWAHESVLNRSRDLPKFQNDYRLPLWVAATCTWGKYDNPSRPSMSEELIWLPRRGGIGVISASRAVYVTGNKAFAISFYTRLFNNRSEILPSRLVGDAFWLASSFSINYQKFHLYGDPTLKLADPRYRVRVESIQPDTLKALSTVEVIARIADQNNQPLTGFNGNAVIQVFDTQDKGFAIDGSGRYDYVYNGGTIFKGLVSVSNGELVGRFIVPKSIKYDASPTGRLSIYAWSDSQGDAIGFSDTLRLYGTETQVSDQDGPDITVSFKDVANFFDGDYVSTQPTLLVELNDANGINLTGEVGHKIELVIDETTKKDVTEFFVYDKDSYKKGKLEYTLPALSSGTHLAKISCWDNLNNYSERQITFRTSATDQLMITEVVNFPNPFSDRTHFTFQLVSPLGSADVTISVYTVTGRKIYEIRDLAGQGFNKLPRDGWDGRDWDGDLIANGVYLYKIVVNDGSRSVEVIDKLALVR